MIVQLTTAEMRAAAGAGVEHTLAALRDRRPGRYGGPALDWQVPVIGALGELVVAKALNLYPTTFTDQPGHAGDVGGHEVRATPHRDGCLILHRGDPDDRAFFLVRGFGPEFDLAGWIYGRDGKRPEFWRTDTGRPAYFVPPSALVPLPDEEAS